MSSRLSLGLLIAILAVFVDQLSKWWILVFVMDPPKVISVTPFFNLVLTWNKGVSFGMFNDQGDSGALILSAIAILITLVLIFWLIKAKTNITAVGLSAIIGGAIGNVIDRLTHGAVLDFLDFYVNNVHWPAFNAADSFITIGAITLIWESLFYQHKSG